MSALVYIFTPIIAVFVVWLLYRFIRNAKMTLRKKEYKHKVEVFVSSQKEKLDSIYKTYSPMINEIPSSKKSKVAKATLLEIISMLQKSELTYEELYLIYFERVFKIGYPLNLTADLHSIFETFASFDKLKWHKFDAEFPLRNIPFSIKDQFKVGGGLSTIGFSSLIENKIESDGRGVKYLKEVFQSNVFVRGNSPQGNFIGESHNFVFGRAKNPINQEYSTGGSSGGDAGLVVAGCIPFGTGADIGGSLRMPANFCGVCTLKPTPARSGELDSYLFCSFLGGQIYIKPVAGFFTKDVKDLEFLMEKFYSGDITKIEMSNTPIPWRKEIILNSRKLKFAFIETDEVFPVCKALKRSLNEVYTKLKNDGHQVVPTSFPHFKELGCLYISIMSAPGGIMSALQPCVEGYEDYVPEYNTQKRFSSVPKFLHRVLPYILKLMNQRRLADFAKHSMAKSVVETYEVANRVMELREEFHQWMIENEYDAVIMPASGLSAFKHGQFSDLILSIAYMFVINTLDVPSGVMPIGKVLENEKFYTDQENDLITGEARKLMAGSQGMPVSIQVVSKRFNEELVMKAMLEIEKVHGRIEFPIE